MLNTSLKVRACAFDAYGTLFDFNTVHRCTDVLGDKASPLRELWRNKQLQYFWHRNMLGEYKSYEAVTADALDVALALLKIDTPGLRDRLIDLYGDLRPYPEVAAALQALKAKGLRLVIHTNASVALTKRAVSSCKLEELFDDIISIEDIGVYKPDPRAYQFLLDRIDTSRNEVCFVSSNGWDTHGAAHFGLPVAWVNRLAGPDDALPGEARFELSDLTDLPLLIERT